jgi:hypothetical protein
MCSTIVGQPNKENSAILPLQDPSSRGCTIMSQQKLVAKVSSDIMALFVSNCCTILGASPPYHVAYQQSRHSLMLMMQTPCRAGPNHSSPLMRLVLPKPIYQDILQMKYLGSNAWRIHFMRDLSVASTRSTKFKPHKLFIATIVGRTHP